MATCPNCRAKIDWHIEKCAACGALFEGEDAWHPLPESAEEMQSIATKYPPRAAPLVPGIVSVFKSAAVVGMGTFLVTFALLYAVSQQTLQVSSAVGGAGVVGLITLVWYVLLLVLFPSLRTMAATAAGLASLLVGLTFFLPSLLAYFYGRSVESSLESKLVGYEALWALIILYFGFIAGGWVLIPITAGLGWLGHKLFLSNKGQS